jgi:xylulose-5-phosphate/fructose-6-phosphate phosphoketolase
MSLNQEVSSSLSRVEMEKMDKWLRAANYLSAAQIYLRENPLLRESLKPEHIKKRLLGHWGSCPGLNMLWVHLNRFIQRDDLNMVYVTGPGHGAPGPLAASWLEGTYGETYPNMGWSVEGLRKFFHHFSFPGGIGSHCTPEAPGSFHEGGELGYSLSHAYGAALDNPELIVACVVGDGEAETGPLAASWHSNKFINPVRDGAVLPILHLNGYKIANPTMLSRVPEEELYSLFYGYGYEPLFVGSDDPSYIPTTEEIHYELADVLEYALGKIRKYQAEARLGSAEEATRPRWPMIVFRTPKGWTCPNKVNGRRVEGFWRSHQVPMNNVAKSEDLMVQLETWLRSYRPEELFTEDGSPVQDIIDCCPTGNRRMSANPITNGGMVSKELLLPDYKDLAIEVREPGKVQYETTRVLGRLMARIMELNKDNFRLFGPDETASNRLDNTYEVTSKTWMDRRIEDDKDGSQLSPDGRVMELLNEHTLEGWLEAYTLTGRHGLLSTYEAFAHVLTSMVNQHVKWLEHASHVEWRRAVPSLNILLSSTVWRQDHNGASHQDPGFIDHVCNKRGENVGIYLPADANSLLVVADKCFRDKNKVNVIVADKQNHLQYLNIDEATKHVAKGMSRWAFASNDDGCKPDVVITSCGDVVTKEALAAVKILRERFPNLKVRFVNVVNLFALTPNTEHPDGFSDKEYNALFPEDVPVIFNHHSYPWLIHRLTYRRRGQEKLHVRGFKELGNINTPLEICIQNQVDRFNIVIDVLDRVESLKDISSDVREEMKDKLIEAKEYAYEHGIDQPELDQWTW